VQLVFVSWVSSGGLACGFDADVRTAVVAELAARREVLVADQDELRRALAGCTIEARSTPCTARVSACTPATYDELTIAMRNETDEQARSGRLASFDGSASDLLARIDSGDVSEEGARSWSSRISDGASARHELAVCAKSWTDPRLGSVGSFEAGEMTGVAIVFDHETNEVVCAADVQAVSSDETLEVTGYNEVEKAEIILRSFRRDVAIAACDQIF
jgi:hypothetical protein